MNAIFYSGSIQDNYLANIFAEIYKDKIYDPVFLGRKDLTILDIGAHIGSFSMFANQFAKKIYAIEPSKEHFECLTEMIKYNKLDNVEPLNYALSDKVEDKTFFHCSNKTMFSLHKLVDSSVEPSSEIVKAIDIETLLNRHNIEKVDFMKLDVEGVEFDVLGCPSFERVAHRIDSMIVELHVWAGRNFHQMYEILQNNGYKVKSIPNEATLIYARRYE